MQNYATMIVRDEAILVDASYVAGTIIGRVGTQIPNLQNKNQLILLVDFTIGSLTTAEIKLEFSNALYYNLAYDGQTANFTVGAIVTGSLTGAQGKIIKDTDGGATGTLVISPINGIAFQDNEPITDNNGTPGVAVVNGGLDVSTADPSDYSFYQETIEEVSTALVAQSLAVRQFSGTGKFRIPVPTKDKYVKVSAQGTGTATGSLMRITAEAGEV